MALALPEFVTTDPITPSGRAKEVNPYEEYLTRLSPNAAGYSMSQTANMTYAEAHQHELAIRRAARALAVGVSVIVKPSITPPQAETPSVLTFGIVPKRVRNATTGQVETPDAVEPETADAVPTPDEMATAKAGK